MAHRTSLSLTSCVEFAVAVMIALAFQKVLQGLGPFGQIPYIIIYEGWYSNPRIMVWFGLAVGSALFIGWARLAKESLRIAALAGAFTVALVVAVVQVDRIVTVPHSWMGSHSVQTVAAPRSPLWRAPLPQEASAGMKSWSDLFPAGGGGGPTGQARLEVNWSWNSARMFFYTAIPFLLASAVLSRMSMFVSKLAKRGVHLDKAAPFHD